MLQRVFLYMIQQLFVSHQRIRFRMRFECFNYSVLYVPVLVAEFDLANKISEEKVCTHAQQIGCYSIETM